MCMRAPSSFQEHFASGTDPRSSHAPNQRHAWLDMLVIAVCAVICGADGWEDIEEYGKAQAAWFAEVLHLPHGIPGHDTCRRVLSHLDPDELTQCFVSWTAALSDLSVGDIVAIDGKTLRHSLDRAAAKAAIHLVSAWASSHRLVVGQGKVDDKSNDITAIPNLLKMLDGTGATVTMDAMGCQKEIAQVITEQGADYGGALKKNHSALSDDVTLLLDDARSNELAEIDHAYHETVAGDHGRIETRKYWITSDIAWGGAKASWANVHSLGMVESRREQGEKVEIARRYYLVSLPADGVRFSNAVRQHWGVENQLHWVLDVSFAEDASRIRKDKGAQTFSVPRHTGDQSQTQASWMGSRLSLTSIDGVIQMRLPGSSPHLDKRESGWGGGRRSITPQKLLGGGVDFE